MQIVLDNGEIVESTLPIPTSMTLAQIKEALDKYHQHDNIDYIRES